MDLRRLSTKILSVILCAVMILSAMPLGVINAFASSDTVPSGYTGIYDIEDLDAVRNDLDGNYILMADIDMTEATAAGGEWDYNGEGWKPIGESWDNYFSGIFDGNGHSIIGMRIKDPSVYCVGLFGNIISGTVRNLRMVNADIQTDNANYVGAIAGRAYSAVFENIAIDNLLMDVKESQALVPNYGGIVGYANGTSSLNTIIRKSYVSGEITVNEYYANVGGIVGECNDYVNITDCYNTATITANAISPSKDIYAGGISGQYGTITNCVNIGSVSGTGKVHCGAIAGYDYATTLSHCYYKKGTASAGKYDTSDTAETAVALTEEQMKQQSSYSYLDFENTWVLDVASGAAYPQLKDNRQFPESEGEHDDVVPEGYTPIYDIEDLYAVRNDLDGNYILMADIDMTEDVAEGGGWDYNGTGWRPIGESSSYSFSGIFDGNGHSITGMRIKNTSVTYVGLFGYISGGTVKNLRMVNADIQDSSVIYAGAVAGLIVNATVENIVLDSLAMTVSGNNSPYIGSVAGFSSKTTFKRIAVNNSTIEASYSNTGGYFGGISGCVQETTTIDNSYVSGNITITTSSSSTSIYSVYVGGIFGFCYYSSTTVTDCYNVANITGRGCHSTYPYYSYYSDVKMGGIIGYGGTIKKCVNIGNITANSYSYAGALNYSYATLSGCYYKKATASSGIYNTSDTASTTVSLTEEQMKLQSVYGYLDFDNTWFLDIGSGKNYPQLISCPETMAERITVSSYPSKTAYLQHEDFDISGLKISVKYQGVETPSEKNATIGMISGYDATVVGTQTLTVTYLGKTATFDVVVSPRPVTGITLNKTKVNLEVAMTEQLTATVLPDNATDKTLIWTSDAESVVTVDNTGLVTAQGTGTATVTVTASNGVSASAEITVLAGHTYGDAVTTITATCFATGSAYKTCTICGHVENITLPVDSTNHSGGTEVRNAVAGNCGEAGYTGDTYCLGCNVMITEGEEITANENHHYESEITSESTCAVAGIRTYTCSVCNDSYTETLDISDDHTWGEPEVIEDATCTTDGYKAIKCTVCGEVLEDGIILVPSSEYPESDHDYQNNINTTYYFSYPGATRLHLKFSEECELETGADYLDVYDGDGYRIKSYTGYLFAGDEITIDGDSFSLTLRTDFISTSYGFSFTKIEADMGGAEIIPATGHNYSSEITSESTCIVAGIRTYTCSACNDSYTEELELSDEHTWGEPEIIEDATCEEDGYKARKCTECGTVEPVTVTLPSSTYPESAHDYSNNSDRYYSFSYPGATKLHLTFSTNTSFESNYDYLYIYEEDDSLYGKYSGTSLAGQTITLDGSSFGLRLTSDSSNTRYGFSFSSIVAETGEREIILATGHDYAGAITTPVTCEEDGVKTFTCTNCGDVYTEDIPFTGHEYISEITSEATCCDDGVITYTCANCSDTYTETIEPDPDAHDMSAWEVITEATCNTEGRKVRKCAECGYVSLSRITLDEYTYPESDHDYLNNENKDYTIFGYEGADKLYLTFSSSTYFEDGCDYLFIYDGSGDYIGRYTGNSLAGKIITIPGDSFSLRLETDDSFTCYGFSFDSIVAEVSDGSADYVSIPATGNHDYVYSTTREATCSREGEITYTCSDCGDSYTESTGRTAHSPGDWQIITGATADTDGMKICCCTVCGAETDRETIPAGTGVTRYLGDASGDGKVTAADARLILRHSARIEILPDNVLNLADVNGDSRVNASDARIALRMASKLEGLFYYGSGDFHAHEYETTIDAEATCTTDGKETKTCKICGETKT